MIALDVGTFFQKSNGLRTRIIALFFAGKGRFPA